MIKAFIGAFIFATSMNAMAASDNTSHLTITNPTPVAYLIPAVAQSCFAKQASIYYSPVPSFDVSPKFFSVAGIQLAWNDPQSTLYVATIQLRFTVPGTNALYTCSISGNELLATSQVWWNQKGASVDSSSPVALNCPLTCGGVSTVLNDQADHSFSTDAKIEVIGYSEDKKGNQAPLLQSTSVKIVNLTEAE